MRPELVTKTELNSTVRGAYLKTAVCLCVLTLMPNLFGKAVAQDAGDKGFVLEEIMVTARKIEENLRDTPIAVTVITGDSLRERDLTQISGVADVAPNVNFSFGGTSSGSGSAAVVYIRGVGQNDFTPVTEPGVGIYVEFSSVSESPVMTVTAIGVSRRFSSILRAVTMISSSTKPLSPASCATALPNRFGMSVSTQRQTAVFKYAPLTVEFSSVLVTNSGLIVYGLIVYSPRSQI